MKMNLKTSEVDFILLF